MNKKLLMMSFLLTAVSFSPLFAANEQEDATSESYSFLGCKDCNSFDLGCKECGCCEEDEEEAK